MKSATVDVVLITIFFMLRQFKPPPAKPMTKPISIVQLLEQHDIRC